MSDSLDSPVAPGPASSEVQHLFVDEAGTPTLFHESGKPIADTYGCSRFFILGKLEVENPPALATVLTKLRRKMLADPIFAGTESFKPERKKTAVAFHAKDDLPEVRVPVFELLCGFGNQLRFYEVKWDPKTRETLLDPSTGLVIREDRFLNAIWPQVGEVHDLHFGPPHGAFFTAREPLVLEQRFPPPKGKKKKS